LTLFDAERRFTRPDGACGDAACRRGVDSARGPPGKKKESMHVREEMTVADGLCKYSPQGRVSLVDGVAMITRTISHCRARKIAKLLMDVTELTGYPIPTLADRFWMVQDWAQAAQGELIVAVVCLPEFIHPGKFGVIAARDAGLKCDVFISPADAGVWLLANETTPRVGANAEPEPRLR